MNDMTTTNNEDLDPRDPAVWMARIYWSIMNAHTEEKGPHTAEIDDLLQRIMADAAVHLNEAMAVPDEVQQEMRDQGHKAETIMIGLNGSLIALVAVAAFEFTRLDMDSALYLTEFTAQVGSIAVSQFLTILPHMEIDEEALRKALAKG